MDVAGKVVLVTGASRGLGLGFAEHLLALGANVVGACRDPARAERLHELAQKYRQGESANWLRVVPLDVLSEESITALPSHLHDVPRVDVLINNAGVVAHSHPADSVLHSDFSEMDRVFRTNVAGVVRVTQTVVPLMESSDAKVVFNISSQLGSLHLTTAGYGCTYRMSKAALNMATRCFAHALAPSGFTVLAVHPGWVDTDMGSAGGRSPPLSVEQSVMGMLAVLRSATVENSGKFLQYDGQELPW